MDSNSGCTALEASKQTITLTIVQADKHIYIKENVMQLVNHRNFEDKNGLWIWIQFFVNILQIIRCVYFLNS